MTLDEITQVQQAIRPGVLARQRTSPFTPVPIVSASKIVIIWTARVFNSIGPFLRANDLFGREDSAHRVSKNVVAVGRHI